jgi:hypothetical protein
LSVFDLYEYAKTNQNFLKDTIQCDKMCQTPKLAVIITTGMPEKRMPSKQRRQRDTDCFL